MKKYIASIIILVVIIGTLTTFFMYERGIASGLPTFHLEKESGDSKKVRNVVMEGTYQQDDISQWWVKITPKETIFPQNQSFFERLDDIHARK
ncbi:hypothetical protein P5G51_018100 [Virgibacillus sp. 179-BFC.A HS]|uniref:DUF3139 domain-containing protein n=1 Tax=Tigheibacillus jepli TaxID=3035914 RepID=A0ABU5CKZ7_9BACI|nr:hypothetical protein [Virgibacillus sp. 179-BFC.A HS]MDY0406996.1 hypothetical protein [Virgibacillus sp. 179-BFC.A HS]